MSWSDSIFKFFGFARYNTVAPTPAAGEAVELQADAQGRLRVALGDASFTPVGAMRVTEDPAGLTWATSAAGGGAASATVKATGGTFYAIYATNGGTTDTWLHVCDGTTRLAPPVKIMAGATISIEFAGGRPFAANLTWAALTGAGYSSAADAAAALYIVARYV